MNSLSQDRPCPGRESNRKPPDLTLSLVYDLHLKMHKVLQGKVVHALNPHFMKTCGGSGDIALIC
jgi:hypothetical protein